MTYKPRLDDYVKWNRSSGSIDEGWVYFVSDEYISIEVLAKCKTGQEGTAWPDCTYIQQPAIMIIYFLSQTGNRRWQSFEFMDKNQLISFSCDQSFIWHMST